ncbi:MAG: hypothetical protein RLZZ214_1430 [Verrucomicrobiota bacterium]|jgi:hypothetical protein
MNATYRPQPLTNLLNANSSDPATHTMLVTSLVLTLWQMGGRAVTSRLPSLLLINAGGAEIDPLDAFIDRHGLGMGHKVMPKSGTGSYVGGAPANAPLAMLNCIRERENLGETTANNQDHIGRLETRFRDAKTTGFGSDGSGPYTRMWNDDMGWITNGSGDILLRFDQPSDREAFRKDLLDHPERLLHPYGPNSSLHLSKKNIAVSGSLSPAEWDESLVCGVMDLGLPVFFLPHVLKKPLTVSDPIELALLTNNFRNSPVHGDQQVSAPIHLPAIEHCQRYQKILRQRLHHLPGGYELSVLRIVHELEEVCERIARHAAPGSPAEEIVAIFMKLHAIAFRGIVISVASLAYHCLGFDPGCPRDKALALMRHLRDKGPLTRRELQRHTQSLDAPERNKVLARLAAEGLVQLDDRKVTAVPLADFVEALYFRQEFL